MNLAIQTRNLTRQFNGRYGIRELELAVPHGAIYGFVGLNGGGKTTTIRLLLNLLIPTCGTIRIFDQLLSPETLRHVGALVESPSLYAHLSGRDNLEITRTLLGAPTSRTDEALVRVGLLDVGDRLVCEYSLGMKQRLGLALALINRPKLLILDEPSNGLDPAGIVDLRNTLQSLAHNDATTIFVSSHLLSEIELIATHVGVIHEGSMRFQGTLAVLKQQASSLLQIYCTPIDRAVEVLRDAGFSVQVGAGRILLDCPPKDDAHINYVLVMAGIEITHLSRPPIALEQLFSTLTKAQA